jgi:N-acetyl-gamma-glutamyl-phosphate reductase
MIRAGIFGASGYTGFELIKLIQKHPQVQVTFATARSDAGKRLSDIYPTLIDQPLVAPEQADLNQVDVVFSCLPHGDSARLVMQALDADRRVVDFSADFRLKDPAAYARWYGHEHPAPRLLTEAVYGLPELHRERIRAARLVANPGCYPTSVILALHPLIQADLLSDRHIIADCKSGVSGAGRGLKLNSHFGEVHETFSAYNIGRAHRHIAEMDQETGLNVTFSPHLLPTFRGILSTIYVQVHPGTSPETLREAYGIYADEPFVRLMPPGKLPELRHVVHNNFCVIGIQPVDVESGRYILVSVEDNLIKGASGQALQSMNIMFNLEETAGLM